MKVLAALLLPLLAAPPAAAQYLVARLSGPAGTFVVSSDIPPEFGPDGTPRLARGALIRIHAEDSPADFEVFLIEPLSMGDFLAAGSWAHTLTRTGGYRVQFGRGALHHLHNLDFIVDGEAAALTPGNGP